MSEGRFCLKAGPAQYLSPVQGAGDPRPGTQADPGNRPRAVHRPARTANVTTDSQQMAGQGPTTALPWATPPSGSQETEPVEPVLSWLSC